MPYCKHTKEAKKASAIVLVMVAVAVLLAAGVALMGIDAQLRKWAQRTASEIASRTAADAGLVRAITEINACLKAGALLSGEMPCESNTHLPNSDATYSYCVLGDPAKGLTITSTGKSGDFTKKVNASLRLKTVWDYAIYASDKILLTNQAFVEGSVSTDPNGRGTEITQQAVVTGKVDEQYWRIPRVNPPSGSRFAETKGPLIHEAKLEPSDSGRYDYVDISKGKKLEIKDSLKTGLPVVLYVAGNFDVAKKGEIKIDKEAQLTLYVRGNLAMEKSAKVKYKENKQIEDHKKCMIIGVGENQVFYLNNDVEFQGIIYAPDAHIYLGSKVKIKGAMAGNKVTMDKTAKIEYDESLKGCDPFGLGNEFVVARWWEED